MKKLPIYFEAFGSVGVTVSFYSRKHKSTVTMLLAECPDEMRDAVNHNWELHVRGKLNSGYELKEGKYVYSEPIFV